eukprot:7078673-Pyramimonas_sp.AAC.1
MLRGALGDHINIVGVTDDVTFFKHLEVGPGDSSWDVVMFAPGACRWSQAGKPIPGQSEAEIKTGTSGKRLGP